MEGEGDKHMLVSKTITMGGGKGKCLPEKQNLRLVFIECIEYVTLYRD